MHVPTTIVTGASRGIGSAIARTLAHAHHRLVLVARDGTRLETVARELVLAGTQAIAVAVDLRQPDAAATIAARTEAAFGHADHVVNNAGTAPTAKAELTTDAMLSEALDLHVRAPLAMVRAFLPAMRRAGSGTLVQVASTAGLRGFPFTTAYTAAKHGMVGLTRALHAELQGSGVRAYAVCPGFVDTDITRQAAAAVAARGRTTAEAAFGRLAAQNRLGRMHTADEVAREVLRLLTERPDGCVWDLDRDPPVCVDPPSTGDPA